MLKTWSWEYDAIILAWLKCVEKRDLGYVNDDCMGSSVNQFEEVYLKLLIGYKFENSKNYNEKLRITKGRENYNVDLRFQYK